MTSPHSNDPLHGVTLEAILKHLEQRYGWPEMGRRIAIRCFLFQPSLTSSLRFLRRTPWARAKVEAMYLESMALARADAEDDREGGEARRRRAPREEERGGQEGAGSGKREG